MSFFFGDWFGFRLLFLVSWLLGFACFVCSLSCDAGGFDFGGACFCALCWFVLLRVGLVSSCFVFVDLFVLGDLVGVVTLWRVWRFRPVI